MSCTKKSLLTWSVPYTLPRSSLRIDENRNIISVHCSLHSEIVVITTPSPTPPNGLKTINLPFYCPSNSPSFLIVHNTLLSFWSICFKCKLGYFLSIISDEYKETQNQTIVLNHSRYKMLLMHKPQPRQKNEKIKKPTTPKKTHTLLNELRTVQSMCWINITKLLRGFIDKLNFSIVEVVMYVFSTASVFNEVGRWGGGEE